MNTLHSPLDALTFDFAAFGFFTVVNNLWTWLALLTAAFSLWKIRAKSHFPPPLPPPPPTEDERRPMENSVLREIPAGTSSPSAGVLSGGDGHVIDLEGVTKGKFTVYYEEESECELDGELTETEAFCDGGWGCESEWWEKWDKMLELKMGVKGWYMCQDLTDLNGNVVRFWDSGNGNCGFEEVRFSSSCIVW